MVESVERIQYFLNKEDKKYYLLFWVQITINHINSETFHFFFIFIMCKMIRFSDERHEG